MSVPVYRRVTGSANQINVTSVYRHTVCNCERASDGPIECDVRWSIVGKVYHCTWAYWPVQRVAFQIEVKWAQHAYSRVYLPRFPTLFFQTSTPAVIRVLRRACTVTLANDASGRGGGIHFPLKGSVGALSRRNATAQDLKRTVVPQKT